MTPPAPRVWVHDETPTELGEDAARLCCVERDLVQGGGATLLIAPVFHQNHVLAYRAGPGNVRACLMEETEHVELVGQPRGVNQLLAEGGPTLDGVQAARVELTFIAHNDLHLSMPHANTPAGWVTFGIDEDLDEAVTVAVGNAISHDVVTVEREVMLPDDVCRGRGYLAGNRRASWNPTSF